MRRQFPLDKGALITASLAVIFAVVFGLTSLRSLFSFSMAGYDLTNMSQAMWNTAHGKPLIFTYAYPITHRLGVHIEPIFFLIAPLYRVFPRPETLLLLQAAIVASGALPTYWLARDHLESTTAGIIFAAAYLLFPALQSGVLYEFHPSVLAAAFWLYALYFLDRERHRLFVAFSLLALSTKEDMAPVLALVGGYAIITKHRWRIGLAFVILGLAWFFVGVFWVQPLFSPVGENVQFSRYEWLGNTPLDMIATLIKRLDKIWLQVWDRAHAGDYLLRLLAPLGFVSLLDPLTLILAVPSLAANLLSKRLTQTRAEEFHYAAPIIPFVVVAAVYGVKRLGRWLKAILGQWRFSSSETLYRRVTLALSCIVLGFSLTYHYYRGFSPLSRAFSLPVVTAHHKQLQTLMQLVPSDAPLLVQPNIAPLFSDRSKIYGFPNHIPLVDYVLIDVSSLIELPNLNKQLKSLVGPESAFGVLAATDGYLILSRHKMPGLPLPDAFFDFARADVTDIQYPTQIRFGNDLEFLGYTLIPDRESEVEVDLFFRPLHQIESKYRITLYLLDKDRQLLGATLQEPATTVWYPTRRWQPNEVVRVHIEAVPWDTRPLPAYQLAIGVLTQPDPWNINARLHPTIVNSAWQGWLPAEGTLIGIAKVEKVWGIAQGGPQRRQYEVPRSADSLNARFSDGISLVGTQLSNSSLGSGEDLKVTIFWQANQPVKPSYVVFVHLLASDGQLRAQSDHIPNGVLPTYAWSPGEVVPDLHMIHLDDTIPSGEYTLTAGMYDSSTQRRLPLRDSLDPFSRDNAVLIGKVSIK
jgi:uncharacterized membrane protein